MDNDNWYVVDKNATSVFSFLEMFWNFHDFRVSSIKYDASKCRIDLVLEYDSRTIRVLLRFENNVCMNFCPTDDYEADWMFGADIRFDSSNRFVWIATDDYSAEEGLPEGILWIKGDCLLFAVVDKNDIPIPIPNSILNSDFGERDWKTRYERFSPKRAVLPFKKTETFSVSRGDFSVSCQELIKNYPPRFNNSVKSDFYKKALSVYESQEGDIKFLQCLFNPGFSQNERIVFNPLDVKTDDGFFNYARDTSNDNKIVWHLNFSDLNLFGFYGSSLFAQDEIQTMEHPLLCSLREYILKSSVSKSCAKTIFIQERFGNYFPTPVLIENVPYWISVDTKPVLSDGRIGNVYGNCFDGASQEELEAGIKVFDGDVKTNIIAMAALSRKSGKYKKIEIDFTLQTALCAFEKARVLSIAHNELNENLKVSIHTGNWGCGVFGGNKEFMYLVQLIAASCAGVDEVVFHAIDKVAFDRAVIEYEKIKGDSITFNGIVDRLYSKDYYWGISDGN